MCLPLTQFTCRRTSRSKRKLERKAEGGRKGTAEEEEYLLNQLTKLVRRFELIYGMFHFHAIYNSDSTSLADMDSLLPHLAQFASEHREAAIALRNQVLSLAEMLRKALDEAWAAPPAPVPEEQSWEARLAAALRTEPTTKVRRPEMKQTDRGWGMPLVGAVSA